MINAIQHSIICETLTIWAAEYAAWFPSVHDVIYDIIMSVAMEFDTCAAAVEQAVMLVEGGAGEAMDVCEEIGAELVDVEPAIGLSGIVPVLKIRNDELGSKLFRHRLPHWGMLDYLGLHRGCRLRMRKRLGELPELSECLDTGRTIDKYSESKGIEPVQRDDAETEWFSRPSVCPYCGCNLGYRIGDGDEATEDWICHNPECKSQVGVKLMRFVSVGGMGIPGMTERIVDQLLVAGKIESVVDLYTLKVSDFVEACHLTHTDAYVLYRSIDRSRMKPLHMLLDGLGIEGIGREDTPLLAVCVSDAGGLSALATDVAKFFSEFGVSAAYRGLGSGIMRSFADYAGKNIEYLGRLAAMGVAQLAMPVLDQKDKEFAKSVPVYGDKDAVKPPKKKRFNYGTMKNSEDNKKPRRMKRRKPRKKPGESDGEPPC